MLRNEIHSFIPIKSARKYCVQAHTRRGFFPKWEIFRTNSDLDSGGSNFQWAVCWTSSPRFHSFLCISYSETKYFFSLFPIHSLFHFYLFNINIIRFYKLISYFKSEINLISLFLPASFVPKKKKKNRPDAFVFWWIRKII